MCHCRSNIELNAGAGLRVKGNMSDAILVIFPYLYQVTWVFDDERVELVREPFVSGIPEMINTLVQDIPDANQGFKLLIF